MKKKKIDITEFDDEALEILYAWANNAILTRNPQAQWISAIINEYERRMMQ